MTVSPASINSDQVHSELKFMVSYYLKEECRVMPLNVPNFMRIGKGSSECVEYILDKREVVVAYSRNIL